MPVIPPSFSRDMEKELLGHSVEDAKMRVEDLPALSDALFQLSEATTRISYKDDGSHGASVDQIMKAGTLEDPIWLMILLLLIVSPAILVLLL